MIRIIAFGFFIYAISHGGWWNFVIAFGLWAVSGTTAAALFTIHTIHRNDGNKRVRTEDDDYV